jgi:hypothetical protein
MSQSPRALNAWKHGGYSNLGVLPGEDPKEFDDFHQALIEEWEPSGSTECDTVLSLAKSMWRKGRLNIYLRGRSDSKKLSSSRAGWASTFHRQVRRDNPRRTPVGKDLQVGRKLGSRATGMEPVRVASRTTGCDLRAHHPG